MLPFVVNNGQMQYGTLKCMACIKKMQVCGTDDTKVQALLPEPIHTDKWGEVLLQTTTNPDNIVLTCMHICCSGPVGSKCHC